MGEIRNLGDRIIKFVEAWEEVIDLKVLEYAETNEEKKAKIIADNRARADKEPRSPFAYIYNWIEIGEDGEVLPHKAKTRAGANESSKLRVNRYPIAADISDYFCEFMPGKYKEIASVDGSVRRSLSKLVTDGLLERNEVNNEYGAATTKHKRKAMEKELATLNTIDEKCFYSVSKNTYIIYFKNDDLSLEEDFFRRYLGEDLFDIIKHERRLIILLKGKMEPCQTLGKEIRSVVKSAYVLQSERRKKQEEALKK